MRYPSSYVKSRALKLVLVISSALLLAAQCSEASLSISETSIDFGNRPLGSSRSRTVTVTNRGQADALVQDVVLEHYVLHGSYSVDGSTCRAGAVVPANGGTCSVVITFTPLYVAGAYARISVNYGWEDAAFPRAVVRNVSGTGMAPVALSNGPAFDYGRLSAGSVTPKSFTLTNWLDAPVTLGSVSNGSLGLNAPFSLTGGTCRSGATLPAAGGQCTLTVSFAPTTLGPVSGNFGVTYESASSAPNVTSRGVRGTGEVPDTVTALSAGFDRTCARLASGNVRCWGGNSAYGALGYGNTARIGDDEFPAAAGDVNVGGSVVQVSTGHSHTCAVLSGGNVRCWGSSANGALGYANPLTIGDDEPPAAAGAVRVGGSVTQVTAGMHTCALLTSGNVRCWGSGSYGSLGYGNTTTVGYYDHPESAGDVAVGGPVVQIAAGEAHTCALLSTGSVRCWGYGLNGQLGYGNRLHIGDDEVPAQAGDVDVGGRTAQIAAGSGQTCALLTNGRVRCWGTSSYGLGYGNTESIGDDESPAEVGDIDLGGLARQIAVGGTHVCALLTNGKVRCWGSGSDGALGYANRNHIGDDEPPSAAGDVDVGGPVEQIVAGRTHTCALLSNKRVRCWGGNRDVGGGSGEGCTGTFTSCGTLGYAHTRNIGDDEPPSAAGDVPVR
ncbi:MAG TPA: choice-of-anchor D domain-containing protein [Polyangiaceae bacterium]|nr:choice-of-anchor D domain-containing protein [Polyangiaceae bacterium]